MKTSIPRKFHPAYEKVKQLQKENKYLGAFIFGSLARGESTEDSDFDVKVVVDKHNPCENINHPVINGVKLDITFQSYEQLKEFTDQEKNIADRGMFGVRVLFPEKHLCLYITSGCRYLRRLPEGRIYP